MKSSDQVSLEQEPTATGSRLGPRVFGLFSEQVKPERALQELCGLMVEDFQADRVQLWIQDPASQELTRAASTGMAPSAEASSAPDSYPPALKDWIEAQRAVGRQPAADTWRGTYEGTDWLAAAVPSDGVVVGALSLEFHSPAVLSRQDLGALADLATAAGVLLSNDRRRQDRRRQEFEERQLEEIFKVVLSARDMTETLREVCRRAARLCDADRGSVLLWDEEASRVVPAMAQPAFGELSREDTERYRAVVARPLEETTLIKRLAATRRPVAIENAQGSPLVDQEAIKPFNVKSILAAPLVARDSVIGALIVATTQEVRPFTTRHMELATAVADHVALALQKAIVLQHTERRLRQSEAQLEMAATLSATLDLHRLLKGIARQAARVCGMDRCSINLWVEGHLQPMMAQFADSRVDRERWKAYKNLAGLPLREIPYVPVLQRKPEALIIDNPREDPLWPKDWLRFACNAILIVPLIRQGQVMGTMILDQATPGDPISRHQVELATTLASQIALAIDHARLHEETQVRLRETQAQLEITRVLSSTLEIKPLLSEITRQAALACGMDRCSISLLDGDRLVPMTAQYADGRKRTEMWRHFKEVGTLEMGEVPFLKEILNTRKAVVLGDPVEDRRWPQQFRSFGIKAALVVPLIHLNHVLGILVITQTHRRRPITPSQLSLATTIASQVALAIDNSRLYEETATLYAETQARLRQTEALLGITRTLNSTLELDPLLREIAQQAAWACGTQRCSFFLVDDDDVIPAMCQYADARPMEARWQAFQRLGKLPVAELPFFLELVRTGQPVTIHDAATDPRWPEVLRVFESKALLAVPLIRQGEVVGAMILNHPRGEEPVSPDQLALASTIASQVALAVDNVRLYEETQRRLRQTEAQLEITRVLSSTLELKALLKEIARQAARASEMDRCSIYLLEGDRVVPMMSQYADGRGTPVLWERFQSTEQVRVADLPYFAEMMRRRTPVIINDPERDPHWVNWAPPGVESSCVLVVPLIRQERVIGALSLANQESKALIRPEQVDHATTLASQVALAIDNARLYTETQERLKQTEANLEIAHTLSSTLKLKPLLIEISRGAARACNMDRCSIHLFEEDRVVPVMSQYADGRKDTRLWGYFRGLSNHRTGDFPCFTRMIRSRGPVIIDHPDKDPLWPSFMRVFGNTSVLAVPMLRQDQVAGAIILGYVREHSPITSAQVTQAIAIASQVVLAIDNARNYEETQRRLRQTQDHLEIARVLGSTLELKPLLRKVTQQAAKVCDMERSSVSLLDGEWVIPAMSQFADGHVDRNAWKTYKRLGRTRLKDLPYMTEMIRRRGPVIIDDPAGDPLWPNEHSVFENTAVFIVPLVSHDEILGALLLGNAERSSPVTDEQVAQATTIASQVALAIDNARLYEETQRRLRQTEDQLKIARTLGSTLEPKVVFKEITQQAARACHMERCSIYLWEEGLLVPVMSQYGDGRVDPSLWESFQELKRIKVTDIPLFAETMRRRGPVVLNGSNQDPLWHDAIAVFESQALLVVPLVREEKVIGAMVLDDTATTRAVTSEQIALATTIGSQVALALDNARLYEEARRAFTDLKAAQDRLVQSEKFQALAEMGAGVAHDFNNLLTAILGRTEILSHRIGELERDSEELQESLRIIELAAQDGTKIVARLLDFTRAKRRPEESLPLDINQILVDTREVSQPRWAGLARDDGWIEVQVQPGDVPTVSGNPSELREVLLNLVYNAIDAMPEGGTLTLSSHADEEWVWIEVQDTGTGMNEEVRRRIFEPFFTTKTNRGSSGLGLSASYGIVRRHGGELQVESTPGRGTTFKIQLPNPCAL